jgi:hypothetical protein
MNELATRPSPTAERMRLHRQRRRDGLRCLTIEIRDSEIDVLIRKGILKADARNDPCAIRDALYAHLDHTLDDDVTCNGNKCPVFKTDHRQG